MNDRLDTTDTATNHCSIGDRTDNVRIGGSNTVEANHLMALIPEAQYQRLPKVSRASRHQNPHAMGSSR